MTTAFDMKVWWNINIKPEDQEKAVKELRIWLKQYPNSIIRFACGDWYNGSGKIKSGYTVSGLKLSREKKIELYDFLNLPITVVEHYDCFPDPVVKIIEREYNIQNE